MENTQPPQGTGPPGDLLDYHPIIKPEKMQICNLNLANHLFFEGPFLKPISPFYRVN